MDYQKTLNSFDFQTNQEPTIEESRTATELGIKSPEMPTLLANQEIQNALSNARNPILMAQRIPKVGICNNYLRNKKGHPCRSPKSLGGLTEDNLTEYCQANVFSLSGGTKRGNSVQCQGESSATVITFGLGRAEDQTHSLDRVCNWTHSDKSQVYWHKESQVCAMPRQTFTYYSK